MKVFSLFSGIGGFDLAMKNLGHEIVGACEIDKYARSVYSRHFPNVPIWEDATKIQPEELPDFDILCGGFPCQAFSLAGRRLGFEDTRGTLFYEIARIAKQKRPSLLFLENVRGLLYHDEGRTLTTIIQVFYELGYDIEWQVINSKYFVPQNRERIFIIGHLGDKHTPKIFPIREVSQINAGSCREAQTKREWVWSEYSNCLQTGGGSGSKQYVTTLDANYSKGGGSRTMINHNSRVRSLTPLECERLQGFPDGYTVGLSDAQRYKCLGNAVTVPVIEFIAKRFDN